MLVSGDIVGPVGVELLIRFLPLLRVHLQLDAVLANAENAHNGSGLSSGLFRKLRKAGIDLFTLGDHVYKREDILADMEKEDCLCRPANYPSSAPGKPYAICATKSLGQVAAISLLGRTFMKPVDCPFAAIDRLLPEIQTKAKMIFVDIHAEATADKYLMAHFLKGKVTAILGTHTHVPTADETLLEGGTAFQCDLGMTGPHDGILGRNTAPVLETNRTFRPNRFTVSEGDCRLSGALIEVDPASGKALSIKRVQWTAADLEKMLETQLGESHQADSRAL